MREHDVTLLTARTLEQARRDLLVSLALIVPGSPARGPVQARLRAIDAGPDRRAPGGDGHD